ncbi:hypothetical protein MP228_008156 [Amoeboaphelidium protococcarum]|nr:hypothetical protein MP228_008156 [Amoeboaphelidium protococcarum]
MGSCLVDGGLGAPPQWILEKWNKMEDTLKKILEGAQITGCDEGEIPEVLEIGSNDLGPTLLCALQDGGRSSQAEQREDDSDDDVPVLTEAERHSRIAQNAQDDETVFIKHGSVDSSGIWGFGDLRIGDVWKHEYASYFVVVAALTSGGIDPRFCCDNLGVDQQSVEGAYRQVIQKVTSLMSSQMFMVEAQGRCMAAAGRHAAVGSSLGRLGRDKSILKQAPADLPKHQLIAWQNNYFKQIVSAMLSKEGVIVDERMFKQYRRRHIQGQCTLPPKNYYKLQKILSPQMFKDIDVLLCWRSLQLLTKHKAKAVSAVEFVFLIMSLFMVNSMSHLPELRKQLIDILRLCKIPPYGLLKYQ